MSPNADYNRPFDRICPSRTEAIARIIAAEIRVFYDRLPETPHPYTTGFCQADFLHAAEAVIAALDTDHVVTTLKTALETAERIAALEADLLECREYLDGHVDVVDGDDGAPAPNKAMRLASMIDESLKGVGQ